MALPYFDPLRFIPIDPMHNLYLGTGKHNYVYSMDKKGNYKK